MPDAAQHRQGTQAAHCDRPVLETWFMARSTSDSRVDRLWPPGPVARSGSAGCHDAFDLRTWGRKQDISWVLFILRRGWWLSIWDRRYRRPRAARSAERGQWPAVVPWPCSQPGLPSQHLSMLLVRSYRTFAPLPVPGGIPTGPSAVCFCGTLLTVTRTGRYQAWPSGSPTFLSRHSKRSAATTSPAFSLHHASGHNQDTPGAVAQSDRATVS